MAYGYAAVNASGDVVHLLLSASPVKEGFHITECDDGGVYTPLTHFTFELDLPSPDVRAWHLIKMIGKMVEKKVKWRDDAPVEVKGMVLRNVMEHTYAP